MVEISVVPGAAEPPYQHRFVAAAGTARAMTRALMTLRGLARLWMSFFLALVLCTALFYDNTDVMAGRFERLVAAASGSLVIVLPTWLLLMALLYLLNLKNASRRVPEGAVWQSAFEAADWIVSGPLSSHRYSYELVRSVRTRGDFVFVQLRGNANIFGYPRALFPESDLARLQDHQSAKSRSKQRARTAILFVACVAVLGVVVAGARVQGDAPDYKNAATIAQALHDNGIQCTYRTLTGVAAFHAASAGECTGERYVVQMYVYSTEQQRRNLQAAFDRNVCEQGHATGGWITGHRWLIGLAAGSDKTGDLPDLRGATGGNFESAQCDAPPRLDNVN